METNSPLDSPAFNTFDALNDAVIATARWFAEHEKQNLDQGSEQQRRQAALRSIDETLERRLLSTFSAVQLEFLDLLISYWRECEVEAGAPASGLLSQH